MSWWWRKVTAGRRYRRRGVHAVETRFLFVFSWTPLYIYIQLTMLVFGCYLCKNSIFTAASGTWLLGNPEVSACITTYIVRKFSFLTERQLSLRRSQDTISSPGLYTIFPTIPVPVTCGLDASPPQSQNLRPSVTTSSTYLKLNPSNVHPHT